MSYCRWSSDDFNCDLYCYEDASGGYTTHVATSRYGEKHPPNLELALSDFPAYQVAQAEWASFADHEMTKIGLPHDGQSFNDPTIEEFLVRILELRELGYMAPDWLIESIEDEITEMNKPHP